MNNGGKLDNGRQEESNKEIAIASSSGRVAADDFGRAISKIAMAQICESVGFESFNVLALDVLSNVSIKYLCDLGRAAVFYANLAGRTEGNVFDVIQGLEDMCAWKGFSGASEVINCTLSSGVMKEIVEYVESAEEIPFAQALPHFPVVMNKRPTTSFLEMGETPAFKCIPSWLPPFPDPHTYIHSPVWNERVSNPHADKVELARQRRKAERSLLSLQQRLVSNDSAVASTSTGLGDGRNGLQVEESQNPFLAKPLQAGEKDVSYVGLPAKLSNEANLENHSSLLETFAPAIEAMKDGLIDAGDAVNNYFMDKRPAVRLKLKIGKKVLGESVDLSLLGKGSGRTGTWFGRDEEKDDKKRRAEFILSQSMEPSQELTQL